MTQSNDPLRVTSGEFQRRIGQYADVALTRPVTITRNGRDRTVMISAAEYARLKRRDREALRAEDFSGDDIDAIAKTTAPPESAAFDSELDG